MEVLAEAARRELEETEAPDGAAGGALNSERSEGPTLMDAIFEEVDSPGSHVVSPSSPPASSTTRRAKVGILAEPNGAEGSSALRGAKPPPVMLPAPAMDSEVEEVVRVVKESERHYSYKSLDEHMLKHSWSRSVKRKDWGNVLYISLGWVLNWAVMLGLLFVFATYGCQFYAQYTRPGNSNGEQLLLSWLWSVGMRFLINEPCLICFGKGLPMIFASEFCGNFCSETIVTCLGLTVEGVVSFLRVLKTG